MREVFLIGGGRDPHGVAVSHRPFVDAAGGPIACLVVDDGEGVDEERWVDGLRSAGATDVQVVALAPGRPVRAADVAGAAGIYVAGGSTPLYRDLLVAAGTDWLPADVPYAGFSAGAAIAATSAIVGGWRVGDLPVCSPDAGEDLQEVQPRPGLGLVPFAVDVHATAWGTLSRLVHAVSDGLVGSGWAVDEHTCLALHGGEPTVHGTGCAYSVKPHADGVFVVVARAAA